MQQTALFRADASPQMGGGHVRRCLVLADALQLAGWTCTFAVTPESRRVVPHLARSAHRVVNVETPEIDALAAATKRTFDLMVIDHYGLDAQFERGCRALAGRILAFDDLANRPHDCDFLLDPAPTDASDRYRAMVGDKTELLLGPEYALLAPEFFRQRLARSSVAVSEGRIFVSFVAADPANVTGKTINALIAKRCGKPIDVVVGASNPHLDALNRAATESDVEVSIAVDSDSIPEIMAGARIGIGAAGGMAWERCCVGLPSLIVTVAENQSGNAAALERAGAARWLGEAKTVSFKAIADSAIALLKDEAARQSMRIAALTMTDGLGANRVASAIAGPGAAADGAAISLRRAAQKDCDAMYVWQTEPGARRFSRNPEPPSRNEHEAWFAAKLGDPRCVFNVILRHNQPVGVLRYDWDSAREAFEISILLAREWQGQAIAAAALALGRRLLPDFAFVADVDPSNVASVALFENSGFRRIDRRNYFSSPPAANGYRGRAQAYPGSPP